MNSLPSSRTKPAYRGHLPQLDGLRALAISLVLLHHFWPKSGSLVRFAEIAHVGWIGVDLFFVISGFLICGILLDTRDAPGYFKTFYARRSLRIFPLYYLFLAAMAIGIPLLQGTAEFFHQSGSLWWYILYAGNIREAITGHEPAYVLAPLWSLSIEEQFYISFPFFVRFLGPQRLWKALWWVVLTAPLFRIVTTIIWPLNERIQYLATFARWDNIALGCVIAVAFRLGKVNISPALSGRIALSAVVILAVVFAVGGLDRTEWFCRVAGYSLTALASTAVVTWAVLARPKWLQGAALTSLGKICYGIYLLQRPSQVLLGKLLTAIGVQLNPTMEFFANCAFAIVVATLSWHLFEKHVLKLKDRFVVKAQPQREAESPGPLNVAGRTA